MEETRLLGLSFGEAYEIIREHAAESVDEVAGIGGKFFAGPAIFVDDYRRIVETGQGDE